MVFGRSWHCFTPGLVIIYSLAGDQCGHPGSWRGVRIKLGSPHPAPLLVTPRCLILTLSWAKTRHARNWIHNQTHFQSSYCWRHLIRIKSQTIFFINIKKEKRENIQHSANFDTNQNDVSTNCRDSISGRGCEADWTLARARGAGGVNIWTQLFRIFPEQRERGQSW